MSTTPTRTLLVLRLPCWWHPTSTLNPFRLATPWRYETPWRSESTGCSTRVDTWVECGVTDIESGIVAAEDGLLGGEEKFYSVSERSQSCWMPGLYSVKKSRWMLESTSLIAQPCPLSPTRRRSRWWSSVMSTSILPHRIGFQFSRSPNIVLK